MHATLAPPRVLLAAIWLGLGGTVSCTSDPGSSGGLPCTTLDAGCAPLYEPSFEQIFARTLQPTCAKSGISCHAETGAQGGLSFENIDTAYRLLTERGVFRAGDPGCSQIALRVSATDAKVRMPPGLSLPVAEQCAIIKWIADGAKR